MAKTIEEARKLYLEQYGSTLVMNNYLKVALIAQSVVLVGMLAMTVWMFRWATNQKPLIVRIEEIGRATAVNYSDYSYRPEAPELRFFLAQFVQFHFSRLLGSVEDRFPKSLFFLDAKLSQAVIEQERNAQSIAVFQREGAEEIDIEINNIVFQDLHSSPMKASVDFQKIFYPRGSRTELRRERYTASFEFVVQGSVPNNMVLVNPLGVVVSYFRVDAAFKP
jgi:type IV secretory pathway TrbF-like protein